MKLAEALKTSQTPLPPGAKQLKVFLACGFTPLHLKTFLEAQLRKLYPERHIYVQTGIYGDLPGNIERMIQGASDFGLIVLEWSDFDPRLGIRSLGGWSPNLLANILETFQSQANSILHLLYKAVRFVPLKVCLPTLPLLPISYYPRSVMGSFDLKLREILLTFATKAIQFSNLKLVNSQHLDALSPLSQRLDVKAELACGFPYQVAHASIIAELISSLLKTDGPKKGLITDLDNTLWHGILGEVGVQGISWDLDHYSHMHALYQQLLHSLSKTGVLIGVASKNDSALVEKAFKRGDLLLPQTSLFPLEIHWGQKSQSVSRILQTWNISAESVVFIDDSLMELEEVKSVHSQCECLLYPKGDDQAIYALLETLRDFFGKENLLAEDNIRLQSLRQADNFREELTFYNESLDDFLEKSEPKLTLLLNTKSFDPRALELVNKTNQFNLNGLQYTEKEWRDTLNQETCFLLMASYEDKYGPLGKIAVLLGQYQEGKCVVNTWVMSCRAFSRRIEYKCLEYLFNHFGIEEVRFDFQATPRNEPLQEFFKKFLVEKPLSAHHISRKQFFQKCPTLFHQLKEIK